MAEALLKKIQGFLEEEEDIIFAGLFTSQGDFIYSGADVEIRNRINDDTFNILRDIDGYAFEDDSLQDMLQESGDETTLIKKVYFKDKVDSRLTISFLFLCALPGTSFGVLFLKMNKFEKIISS
jgi:hypothetical protein